MNWGDLVGIAFLIIIVAAAIGLAIWFANRATSEAYSVRQHANAKVLDVIVRTGEPHNVTLNERAIMKVSPAQPHDRSIAQVEPPQTSNSVRYLVDGSRPDSQERQDLLKIVNHSLLKLGDCGLIRSADKCYKDGLIIPQRWQDAINYGVLLFGVVATPRDTTQVGAYSRLSRLADAICKYETINPTAPDSASQKDNKIA